MRLTRAMVIALAAGPSACGSSTDYGSNPSSCTPSATQICMTAATYNPTSLTVTSGATVTWRDGSGIAHTITSDPGAPEAFNLSSSGGGTASKQFNMTGTYNYHCTLHGSPGTGMHGTLTVN